MTPIDKALDTEEASKYWDDIWSAGVAKGQKWDTFKASPLLVQRLQSGGLSAARRALVPGCGRGYDVEALASIDAAQRFVVGLELSETAKKVAEDYLLTDAKIDAHRFEIKAADFFRFALQEGEEPFDFFYDTTFFCAIHPSQRPEWASRAAALLRPKTGELMIHVFPIGKTDGEGPPFLSTVSDVREVLTRVGMTEVEEKTRLDVPSADAFHTRPTSAGHEWKSGSLTFRNG
eukprot:Selendium_serpulae@DN4184_c0_g1_i2.p1